MAVRVLPSWTGLLFVGLAAMWIPSAPAAARDRFALTNGAELSGRWLNPDKRANDPYRVEVESGAVVVLTPQQVHKVVREPAHLDAYRKAAAEMADTAEAHFEMAERCRKAGLEAQRRFHLERVLQLAPDHEGARKALGFVRSGDRWVMPDERFERLGYVKHRGRWMLPQEIELESRQRASREEEVRWRQKLRRWRNALMRGKPQQRQEALVDLEQARSPYLVPAIARLLKDGKEPDALRRLYVEVLGNLLPDPGAAALLAQIAMQDRSAEIVEAAIAKLAANDGARYSALFVPYLRSKENARIRRAARVLGELGDRSVIPALIDALVTRHRRTLSGPGMQVGRGSGGTGLAMGGGPRIVEYSQKNKEVLTALLTLVPDRVNFEYDKARWRAWYARWKLPSSFDLRRDP